MTGTVRSGAPPDADPTAPTLPTGPTAPTGPAAAAAGADPRELYRKLAAGVAVVTAAGPDGPTGLTVSALTSLSLAPPLLLVCVRNGSRTLGATRWHGLFAVHLLGEGQRGLAERFADDRLTSSARFAGLRCEPVLGVPVLAESMAWALCSVVDIRSYGDHSIVVGGLVTASTTGFTPLIWHDRSYRGLTDPD